MYFAAKLSWSVFSVQLSGMWELDLTVSAASFQLPKASRRTLEASRKPRTPEPMRLAAYEQQSRMILELSGGMAMMASPMSFIWWGESGLSLQYSPVLGSVVQGPHC